MELKVGAFGAEGLVAPMSRTKVCMRRERRFKPTGFPPGGTPRLHGGQDARRYAERCPFVRANALFRGFLAGGREYFFAEGRVWGNI